MMCRVHGVSRGGFYAWAKREPSAREQSDQLLVEQIERVHAHSRGNYGSPRVQAQLRQEGLVVGRRRVARLMRLRHLHGRSARNTRRSSAAQRRFFASVPNQQRKLQLHQPDQVWVADVTYLRVNRQWRYLATVMDRYSRRVLGWSLGPRRDAALTTQALDHATRKRNAGPGLVFHTDRGMEYAALDFKRQLARRGFIQSMNRPGKMNDNAHMESFFHTMKTEGLHGMSFDTDGALHRELHSYIRFYNQQRLHSSLDYLAPAAFERRLAYQSGVN
jgi:transposase InsO family protein